MSATTTITARRSPRKQRLTDITVKQAKPAGGRYIIWDTKQHGLALAVRPTGGKTFYCIYSRRGRPRWHWLADARDVGLADARVMCAEAMLAVAKGGDPAAERRAARVAGTFAELVEVYFNEYAKQHKKSWRQSYGLIHRFAVPRWGKLPANEIARDDVKALKAAIEKPSVATQAVLHLSAVFTWALKEDDARFQITANPCRLVAEKTTNDRERVLADSEVAPFWNALDDVDRVDALALRMILLTGQRPGEVRCMRREHIKDGWWHLPGKKIPELRWPGTKNGESNRVWLSAPAQKILAELDDGDATGFVFANERGGPGRNLDTAMRELVTTLKIERITPHDLRRTCGTTIAGLRLRSPGDGPHPQSRRRHGRLDL